MTAAILAWHFLADGGLMRDGQQAVAGKRYTVKGPLRMCKRGLHGSRRAIDALQYAPGSCVQRVEHSGTILTDTDKLCSTVRTTLWVADATRTLHEFALWCVEETPLSGGRVSGDLLTDPCSREALRVKRLWLDGAATDSELAAAWDAAWAAAWASAWDAARAAAGAAVWAAAWAAAQDAAWDVAQDAQNLELERRLTLLEPR